jgi:hypothetical protein
MNLHSSEDEPGGLERVVLAAQHLLVLGQAAKLTVAGLVSPDWLVEVEAYACSGRSGSLFGRGLSSF